MYECTGMDSRIGHGDSLALVVIDLQRAFADPESPLGGDLAAVVERTRSSTQLTGPTYRSRSPVSSRNTTTCATWARGERKYRAALTELSETAS
jgi:hypothetical protein